MYWPWQESCVGHGKRGVGHDTRVVLDMDKDMEREVYWTRKEVLVVVC